MFYKKPLHPLMVDVDTIRRPVQSQTMGTLTFDTHAFVKRLTAVGITEEQAEVFANEQARLIDETIATKRDLKELEARLDARFNELELRLTLRLGGMLVAGIAVVAALVKLL